MSKTSLITAFNIEKKKNKAIVNLSDYEIFKDKELLDSLRKNIIENLIDKDIPNNKSINDFINEEISNTTVGYDLSNLERSYLYNLIDNEINGYGPLTEILEDESVSKIMVNSPSSVYIEIDGILSKDKSISFINEEHILRTINRLLLSVGKSISQSNPIVDARLNDGSRINVVIPPLSSCPVITIHKFMKNLTTIDDMIRVGSCTPYMARFLEAAVFAKLNILICGTSSSGKTTLLNILSNFINEEERIITIEDTRELELHQENVVSLETRSNAFDSKDDINTKELLTNSLRMRPDRLIVGEIKGDESFLLLQAMNTGHNGVITTMHSNGVNDAFAKLETMTLMGGIDIPIHSIREYICGAIDLVVCIEKLNDGKKKITRISEISGINKDKIIVDDIFAFIEKGIINNGEVDGEYILYDREPRLYEKIKNRGIDSVDDIFLNDKKLPKKRK